MIIFHVVLAALVGVGISLSIAREIRRRARSEAREPTTLENAMILGTSVAGIFAAVLSNFMTLDQ